MLAFFFLSSVVCLLSSAFAADKTAPVNAPPTVDPALCRALVKYRPAPDVEYQPGVDVHGNPVAPADLPGGTPPIQIPKKIQIPITISLANALKLSTTHFPASQLGAGTEAWIGTFTVDGDKVFFNDQPLTDDQQDKLAVLCMKPNK